MADTRRSISTILGLYADNTTGNISPQDARDMIVSIKPPFGGLYFTTPAVTTISGAGSYVKGAGTTTAVNLSEVDMPANNRLRYTGLAPVHCHIVAQASLSLTTGTNQDIGIQVWRYDDSGAAGALLAHSEARTTIPGTSIVQITTHADAVLDVNDYIELHVGNNTNTNDIQIDLGYLFFVGMAM